VSLTYKQAGVDIDAGDDFVRWIQANNKNQPHAHRILSGIGGFAAIFDGRFAGMKAPQLVTCTDGVGTKVKLAADLKRFEGIGQDLVAMSVNDLICTGAEPLFFLDYFACGRLEPESSRQFLTGVIRACAESDCALLGGETAEMPGVYAGADFDCAGFAVGVVDREAILGAHRVQLGDRILGVSSSGFHSNGFSLVRQLWRDDVDRWADRLLQPTHLYVQLAKKLFKLPGLSALAHITGGGLDNLPRVLPAEMGAELKPWPLPELFEEARRRGNIPAQDLYRTFNCGVGLTVVVRPDAATAARDCILQSGFDVVEMGQVVAMGDERWRWREGDQP
jgi:phosphoribosylformylglycinamidine cyclo-ligase